MIAADILSSFHLLRPLWIIAIAPGVLLAWYFVQQKKQALSWRGAISEQLLKHLVEPGNSNLSSKWNTNLPWYFFATGWIIACIALAGPTWEKLPQPVHQRQDALVIVLDLSLSMLAEDIKPSRIVRARYKILDILAHRNEGLTALIAYSGDAHIVSPLTDDNPTIANLTPALSPEMMPLFGSNPTAALQLAKELFKNANVSQGKVLLISDDITENNLTEIGDDLISSGHELSILGIGTVDGAPIPTGNGFLKDNSGNIIVPQLHRQYLEDLAEKNAGRYTDVSLTDDDIQFLLPPIDPELDNTEDPGTLLTDRLFDQWQDRGAILVLCLLPFALIAFRRGWILLLPLLILEPNTSVAFEWEDLWQRSDQRGSEALNSGDAKGAAKLFKDKHWQATANYKAKDYIEAEKNYKQIGSADGHYNQGNALAKAGKYDQAIKAYDKALEKQPDMEDAQFNKQLVEQLKQQQEQQEQKNQDQQQDNEQSEDQQKDDKQQDSDKQSDQDSEQQKQDSQQDSKQDSQEQSDQNSEEQNSDQNENKQQDSDQEESEKEDTQGEPPSDQQDEKESDVNEAQLTEAEQLDQQQQQAMEQWLRKIPDEPSGLLRRKFKYESQQRQQKSTRQQGQPQW